MRLATVGSQVRSQALAKFDNRAAVLACSLSADAADALSGGYVDCLCAISSNVYFLGTDGI